MQYGKGLLVGLVAIGLVGCGNTIYGSSDPGSSASRSPALHAKAESAATQGQATEPKTRVGAHAAAEQFFSLYSANRFAASWNLLTPAAKRQVPQNLWVRVHEGCAPAGTAARIIKEVTVFGNAAIVTERVTGTSTRSGTAGDVFNYVNGRWGYLPQDLSIYYHKSIAADIAAAKAAGYCAGKEASPL